MKIPSKTMRAKIRGEILTNIEFTFILPLQKKPLVQINQGGGDNTYIIRWWRGRVLFAYQREAFFLSYMGD